MAASIAGGRRRRRRRGPAGAVVLGGEQRERLDQARQVLAPLECADREDERTAGQLGIGRFGRRRRGSAARRGGSSRRGLPGTDRRSPRRSTSELACTTAPRCDGPAQHLPADEPLDGRAGWRRNQQSYTDTTRGRGSAAPRSSCRGRRRAAEAAIEPRPVDDAHSRARAPAAMAVDAAGRRPRLNETMYSTSSTSSTPPTSRASPPPRARPRSVARPAGRRRRRRERVHGQVEASRYRQRAFTP